jgi:hypothetical protein
MWEVPSDLRGNALCCAYTYLFYKLYGIQELSSFVVSFDAGAKESYEDVDRMFKIIDTYMGAPYAEELTKYFDNRSWQEIIGEPFVVNGAYNRYESEMTPNQTKIFKGSFDYIAFSDSSVINYMHAGKNTSYIRY